MQIQQLNRTDAEKVFIIVKNVDGGGSITTGMGAAFSPDTASDDGVNAVQSTGALSALFAGVAQKDIAINGFGLVQVWGFAASVAISQSVGSWTVTAGDILRHSGDAGHFASVITDQAISTQLYRYIVAMDAVGDTVSNPRVYMSGFVKAL